jgi:hypothetical protein
MRTPATVAGNSTYTEEKPPLYTAFSMAAKRPGKSDQQSADNEEETWFEGAD